VRSGKFHNATKIQCFGCEVERLKKIIKRSWEWGEDRGFNTRIFGEYEDDAKEVYEERG